MGYDYVVKVAKFRTIKRNQNYMLCITGPTGSGKSYTAMSISLMIDDTFNVDRVCFNAKEFIQTSNMDLPPGSVIMFDEAGIDLSGREWYSKTNKAINQVVETFRRDNLVCVFTTPVFDNLDKKTRHYFHAHMEVLDPSIAGWGACKYFNIIVNSNSGELLRTYPKIKDDQGRTVKMQGEHGGKPNMRFPDPRELDKKLVEDYEKKKKEFTEGVKTKGLQDLIQSEQKIEWEIDQIVGHLAHNPKEYGLDTSKSTKKLTSRVYTKLMTSFSDIDVSRKDVRDAIEYIKNSEKEAKTLARDPMEDEGEGDEYILSELDREKHYDVIRQWRLPPNPLSLQKIADKLGISFGKFNNQYRKKFNDIEDEYEEKMREKRKERETATA